MAPPSPVAEALLAYWRVPPAAGAAWVEMFAPLQFAPYPLRDVDGRPLGEENAPAWARDGVTFDERACPYDDPRRGKPMNAAALRQVRQDWAWCLATVADARRAYAARHGLGDTPLDAFHLFGFAAAIGAWPLFLVRAGRCADDAVPVRVASLFKVVQGVFMVAWARLTAPDAGPIPPVDALAREVAHGPLVHSRSSSRVCGGSTSMIAELLARCVQVGALAPDPAEPDPPRFDADALTYGCVYAALSLDKWLFGARPPADPADQARRDAVDGLRRALAPALADLAPGPARLTAAQVALAAACGAPPPDGAFDPGWLARR